VIVTAVEEATAEVVMVNAGELVVPAGTVTEAGTAATAALLVLSVTTAPTAGAAAFSVTLFAVVETPPVTVAGFRVSAPMDTEFTVSVSVLLTPL
jgi:hypothetical protein